MNTTKGNEAGEPTGPPPPSRSPFGHESTILHLVADPYKYGHRDRVPVDLAAINNRSLIDSYFDELVELQYETTDKNDEETRRRLREHEKRLAFFQAYYLLANGYYTEQELRHHPGVVEVVRAMRERGELAEGDDIEYDGFERGRRDRGDRGSHVVRRRKSKKGWLARLLSVM